LVKPAWIFTEFWVHNQVGHEAWGQYTALLSFSFLFVTLSDLGLNQYTTAKLASEPQLVKSYFPNLLTLKLILAGIYPLLMGILGWLWGYTGNEIFLLVLIALIHGGSQIKQFYRANFQAMQAFGVDAYASITERFLLLILVWVLLFTYIDVTLFIYARMTAVLIAVGVFSGIIRRMYGKMLIRLDFSQIKPLLSASLAFALITILNSFLDKVDQVMLERIAGERETSLYAAAYRWVDAVNMYLNIVLAIYFARFAKFVGKEQDQKDLLKSSQIFTTLPILFISIWIFFFGQAFIEFLFTNSTTAEIQVMTQCLKVLFIAVAVNGCCWLYGTYLSATGYIKYVNWIILLGIVGNIIANLWLIPSLGALGAAWTTLFATIFVGLMFLAYIHFILSVRIPIYLLLKMLGWATIIGGFMYGLYLLETNWLLAGVIGGAVYTLGCIMWGFLPKEVFGRLGRK